MRCDDSDLIPRPIPGTKYVICSVLEGCPPLAFDHGHVMVLLRRLLAFAMYVPSKSLAFAAYQGFMHYVRPFFSGDSYPVRERGVCHCCAPPVHNVSIRGEKG